MMSSDEIAAVRARVETFSGLQHVVSESIIQWPWTSSEATNQIVDLVRAVPEILDALATSQARERALAEALAFYAEVREYNRVGGDPIGTPPPIMNDKGRRARAALHGHEPAADAE